MSFPTMWYVHTARIYYVTVKLLTEHHLEAAQARLSQHLSKCHIVGNHMSRLISVWPKKIIKIRSRLSVPGLKTMVLDLTGKMRFILTRIRKPTQCIGKHWI